jgi:hypothetical protein
MRLNFSSDVRSDAMSCLDELVQSQPEVFKGGVKKSIAQIVRDVVEFAAKNSDAVFGHKTSNDHGDLASLKDALAASGLALARSKNGEIYLAVPTAHRLIAEIYKNSDWKAKAGHTGGWAEALSRLPGAKFNNYTARIGGRTQKCVGVPIEHVLPPDAPEPADAAATPVKVPEEF